MNKLGKQLAAVSLLLLTIGVGRAACPPAGLDRAGLVKLKEEGFQVADPSGRERLLLDMVDCLADPDPAVRDAIAY